MALIGLQNHYIVGVTPKTQRIEEWCEEHIGPYNKGWYWVFAYGGNLIIRIIDDEDATMFKLAFMREFE